MTTPAATAALALGRSIHNGKRFLGIGVPDAIGCGWVFASEVGGEPMCPCVNEAAAILDHPFTPAERAALAAVLLTPEVLAEALARPLFQTNQWAQVAAPLILAALAARGEA